MDYVDIAFAVSPRSPFFVRFMTNLEEVKPGFGLIYHMAHLDLQDQMRGDLTLAAKRGQETWAVTR